MPSCAALIKDFSDKVGFAISQIICLVNTELTFMVDNLCEFLLRIKFFFINGFLTLQTPICYNFAFFTDRNINRGVVRIWHYYEQKDRKGADNPFQ